MESAKFTMPPNVFISIKNKSAPASSAVVNAFLTIRQAPGSISPSKSILYTCCAPAETAVNRLQAIQIRAYQDVFRCIFLCISFKTFLILDPCRYTTDGLFMDKYTLKTA